MIICSFFSVSGKNFKILLFWEVTETPVFKMCTKEVADNSVFLIMIYLCLHEKKCRTSIHHLFHMPLGTWYSGQNFRFAFVGERKNMEIHYAAAASKSLQSCPNLCDPIDGLLPGSSVPGIFQARMLEWVAISFSNAWKCKVKVKSLSHVQLLATPWTAAYQASLSMGFSRQECWSGLPFPSPMHENEKWKWSHSVMSDS